MSTEYELDGEIEQALEALLEAFARYPTPPVDVSYCRCCFEEADMRRFLQRPRETLSCAELEPILWDSFLTWGDWPSLAYYVPRLLEFYAGDPDCGLDREFLLYKLLWAARPEVGDKNIEKSLEYIGEVMREEERRAIFRFIQTVVDAQMRRPAEEGDPADLIAALNFLAAFDAPIAPLVERWKTDSAPDVRGRLCLLVAHYALHFHPADPRVENTYAPKLRSLPENVPALASLVEPAFVSEYLLENAEAVALFDDEMEAEVGSRFSGQRRVSPKRSAGIDRDSVVPVQICDGAFRTVQIDEEVDRHRLIRIV